MRSFANINTFNRKWTLPLLVFLGLFWASAVVCSADTLAQTNSKDEVLVNAELKRSSEAKPIITLKSEVSVKGPNVYLREIADIKSDNKQDLRRLGDVKITIAPQPNTPLVLKKNIIQHRLFENQFKAENVILDGSKTVSVSLLTTVVEPDEIVSVAKEYIESLLSGKNVEYIIEVKSDPNRISVPAREFEMKAQKMNVGRLKGSFPVYVGFFNGGKKYRSTSVNVNVRTFEEAVKVTKHIKKGEVFTPEVLERSDEETTSLNWDVVGDIEALIGKEASKNIQEGKVLNHSDFTEPRVIKRGDDVQIRVESGAIIILTNGIAQKDGKLGDVIPVISQKKRLNATVTGSGKVLLKK